MRIREIENRLKECPDVREVRVLHNAASGGRAYPAPVRYQAFVVLSTNSSAVRGCVRAHCIVRLKKTALDFHILDQLSGEVAGSFRSGDY